MKKTFLASFFSTLLLGTLAILFLFYLETRPPSGILCKDCNVILISMTNLRWDHMSSNGYFRPTTPNLDKLAKESLVFENAFAHSSWTLPEGISLFTGLYPYQHGVMNRYDGSKLSEDIPTLIDVLTDAGYTTGAFTGGFDYNPEYGLTGRFQEYTECDKQGNVYRNLESGSPGAHITDYGELSCTIPKALDWLRQNASDNFFLFVQGYDAHCPFSQQGGKTFEENYQGTIDYSQCLWTFDRSKPVVKDGKTYYPVYSAKTGTSETILSGEEDLTHLVALYDEGITSADQLIGSFLDEVKKMGLSDKTMIVFTSEHGDMFGKYGRFMRGGPLRGTFYDDVLHVPLMVKHPGLSPRRVDGLVGHIDFMPTLLEFLGIKKELVMDGQSLIPLIFQNQELNPYIFAGAEFHPNTGNAYYNQKTRVEAIRSKEWKLIRETIWGDTPSQTVELYDILNDKEELNNLKDDRQDVLQDLQTKLTTWSDKMRQ